MFPKLILILLISGLGEEAVAGDSPNGRIGSFQNAVAFSIDPAGNVYVLDAGRNQLVKLSPAGNTLQQVGGYGWSELEFDHPTDVVAPNGLDVYVADERNHRIQRFDRNLNFVATLVGRENRQKAIAFAYPKSAAVSRLGALFVVDSENKRIVKLNPQGEFERTFGGTGYGRGTLNTPSRIRVSEDDYVYVQDRNRIVVFDIFGNFVRTMGDSLFRRLRAFTVDRTEVYALDSCAMYHLNDTVSLIAAETTFGSDVDLCYVRDIVVRGDEIDFLTSTQVVRVRLDAIDPRLKR